MTMNKAPDGISCLTIGGVAAIAGAIILLLDDSAAQSTRLTEAPNND